MKKRFLGLILSAILLSYTHSYAQTKDEFQICVALQANSFTSDKEADDYYNSRKYGSRIGAWASKQSTTLKNRDELLSSIDKYKKKYPNTNEVPRPEYWSGWRLIPSEIEFWLDGENRIHERLKYKFEQNKWDKFLLSP